MTEQDWIACQQLASGAIVNWGGHQLDRVDDLAINPYFANFAALGLCLHPDKLEVVRRWMTWYLEHMNRPDAHGMTGTVYDYHLSADGTEHPTKDYDSVDSYASTFLNLALAYWNAGGDRDFIRAHREALVAVAEVMIAIMDDDDLTWAKPGWMTKYLMDNCEVYAGFRDAADLWALAWPEDHETRQRWSDWQQRSRTAILTTLDHEGDSLVSLDESGDHLVRRWDVWYADAASAVYPALWGVIAADDPRAVTAWTHLNEHFPAWPELENGDSYPWCIVGYAAIVMGDRDRARRLVDAVRTNIIDQGRAAGRWYCAEAGWLLRIEAALAS